MDGNRLKWANQCSPPLSLSDYNTQLSLTTTPISFSHLNLRQHCPSMNVSPDWACKPRHGPGPTSPPGPTDTCHLSGVGIEVPLTTPVYR
ncbi:hypothetical protein PCANC_25880 [Puccinia coronata f. sp. avenae]|uniref:Uncharacterized protein n=1 Tax=Puccinia coronata f. sp. avenae TaxID=200324 RepID=A0A2N5THY9_9BASI|nr:hypothetical protein PCANC_25880 [Puccinia coronata f. sp. avenae]